MRTAGFDLVLQMDKRLVNKALDVAFNDKLINPQEIPQLKGQVEVPELPQELSEFKNIEYELKLNAAPAVDTLIEDINIIRINFDIGADLTVSSNGLKLSIEAIALVDAAPTYDQANQTLDINLKNAEIFKIVINNTSNITPQVIDKMNQIIQTAINTGLFNKVENVKLSAISTELPQMPPDKNLTIRLGAIKELNNRVLVVAVNFLGFTGGDVNQLSDFFNPSNDICLGMSGDAMHRIFKYWWDNTTSSKEISQPPSTLNLLTPLSKEALEGLNLIEKLSLFLTTIGLFIEDTEIDSSSLILNITVKLDNMPQFELKANEKIELHSFDIHLDLKIGINVKTTTKYKVLGRPSETRTGNYLLDLSIPPIPLTLNNVEAEITLTPDKELEANVKDLNVEVNLPSNLLDKLPLEAINWILKEIKESIMGAINPIPLSPSLILEKIPKTLITVKIDLQSLNSDNDDVLTCANLSFLT